MSSFAHEVIEFNQQVLKIEPREVGPLTPAEFDISVKALKEEIEEFATAYEAIDIIGQIDAMVDLQYFAMGVLYKLGMTAEQINKCCTAVHKANMGKKLGIKPSRGDGSAADAIKPDGWVAPELAIMQILEGE
jgi:predicted HAD superfamily Cof-like phosphohydrolase